MFFKVVHNKEVHVYNSKGQSNFEALQKYIQDVFKQLPQKYYLTYFDEEDEITLACESDFETMKQISQKTVKVFIKEVDESYYDETQKVVLDDEAVEPLEEKMQELRLSESQGHASLSEPESEKPAQNLTLENQFVQKPTLNEAIPVNNFENQPQIIEETQNKIEQQSSILNQSQIQTSRISQVTEAQIQEKFREMMPEFMEKVKDSLLRKSRVQSEASQKPRIVHDHIICDQCGKQNIEGVRYKCAVCADFDLCQKCESTSSHDHPFLKIKHPGQTPYKLIAVVRDEQQNSFEVNGQKVQLPQFPFVNHLFDAFRPRSERSHEGRFGHHGFGFGRGRRGCPFKNKSENNEEMRQEKVEQKCEPQKKTKIQEPPVENKMKVQEKTEIKNSLGEQKHVQKKQAPKRRQAMQVEESQYDHLVENAKYLFCCLDGCVEISEEKSYEFAVKHPKATKQQLLELYFSEKF